MKETREDDLVKMFLLSDNIDYEKLKEIEIQEIIFLIYSVRYFENKKELSKINCNEKTQVFFKALQDKIKTADELYITYDKNTNYPYVDSKGRAWIFSKKDYADNTKDYFMQQLIELEMKKISKEEITNTFANFHRLGIKKILVDNGKYTTEVNRDNILAPPDWSNTPQINIPVINPELQCAMIAFFQVLYSKNNYGGKEQVLHKLEDKMIDKVISAKYLIPMQLKEKSTPNEDGAKTLKGGDLIQLANLKDKDDKVWQPAFTDWTEFEKIYDKKVWSGNIATYKDLLYISKNMEGIVVNPNGNCLRINENNKKAIEKYMGEKNNPKPKTVKEQVVKKDTKVMLGEPKDYPFKMVEAIKTYMKKKKCIKAAYLRLMIKENEKSYLVVVDFNGTNNEIFKGIADAALPHLNGMFLDMVGMDDRFGKEAVKNVKPFYKKKIFGIF